MLRTITDNITSTAYNIALLTEDYDPYEFDNCYSEYNDPIEQATSDNIDLIYNSIDTLIDFMNDIINNDDMYIDEAAKLLKELRELKPILEKL